MTRWPRGQAEVDAALNARHLQQVTGAAANGEPLLDKAARTLESANALLDTDPDTAYVLAYDAARYSGTALLAHQGLRPTTAGGHYAVETVLRAQFGGRLPQVRRAAPTPKRTGVPHRARRPHHARGSRSSDHRRPRNP